MLMPSYPTFRFLQVISGIFYSVLFCGTGFAFAVKYGLGFVDMKALAVFKVFCQKGRGAVWHMKGLAAIGTGKVYRVGTTTTCCKLVIYLVRCVGNAATKGAVSLHSGEIAVNGADADTAFKKRRVYFLNAEGTVRIAFKKVCKKLSLMGFICHKFIFS